LENTFLDNKVFESLDTPPIDLVIKMFSSLERTYGKSYTWALGAGRQLSSGYILAKRNSTQREDPSSPSLILLSSPC